jgi:hypothetical protein
MATTETTPVIHDCASCGGTGHVNYHVCSECEGYGLIDSNGVKHMSMERVHKAMASWAAQEGWPFGCPIPSIGPATNRPIIAPRHPFAKREVPIRSMPELLGNVVPRELQDDDGSKAVNCWYDKHGALVWVVEEKDGKRYALSSKPQCIERLDMMIETLACRLGAVTSRSEAKAFMNLAERLTESQIDCYLLNGAFLETSKRSGVRYIFRKGLPTIALRDNGNRMRFLAALCMHPIAYFENTFCGAMAPSDDVLAHLLFMRTDERKFWAQCNQHPIWALQSGI